MSYHSIILTKADGVAVIQMNNPNCSPPTRMWPQTPRSAR